VFNNESEVKYNPVPQTECKVSKTSFGASVITVTYNSVDELPAFIESFAQQKINYELHIVDNASTDETSDMLKKYSHEDSRIKIILNDENVGLAAANNQPIKNLKYDYVVMCNPDVILHDNTLLVLAKYLENHQEVVAVGPVNLDENGNAHSSFHRSWSLLHLAVWRILPTFLSQLIYKRIRNYDEQNVLFASGSCLMIRRDDYQKIKGYDPEYFLTVEDVCDLCIRLCSLKKESVVRVIPDTKITHLGWRSGASAHLICLWHSARGSIYHFFKHNGLLSGLVATFIVLLATSMRLSIALLAFPFSNKHRHAARNQAIVLVRIIFNNPILNRSK